MRFPILLCILSVPLTMSACTLRAAGSDAFASSSAGAERTFATDVSSRMRPRAQQDQPEQLPQPGDIVNTDETPETPGTPGTPAVPPPLPPPVRGKVKWASPKPRTILFHPDTVTLDWTSTFPEGTLYSVTLSTDKKTFSTVIANYLTATSTPWEVPDLSHTIAFLRVKAMDASGRMLGSDTVNVHLLPKDAIIISKENQRLWAFRDGKLRQRYVVSTGESGYDTRAGFFHVYSRETLHRSRLYDVDMPYALFFSGGQAVHASTALRHLGSPASHGCVRLPRRNARTLFNDSSVGRPVIVTRWGQDMRYLDAFLPSRSARTATKGTRTAGHRTERRSVAGKRRAPEATPTASNARELSSPGTLATRGEGR